MNISYTFFLWFFSIALANCFAEDAIEQTFIIGTKSDAKQLTGSAHVVDEEDISAFQYTDLTQILKSVPGVYTRDEDGFGLRPNIGIRGVTAERSQKITVMEDGILITPAPYAAPAAYYVPNALRMNAIEVFKGPAAIQYGPHTVGGAINMVTFDVPADEAGLLQLGYGDFNQQKYRLRYGKSLDSTGFAVDFLRYSSDGFKSIDQKAKGFVRNDINLRFNFTPDTTLSQQWTIKLGYADEKSDETYLGISALDFKNDPNQRYAASDLDELNTEHYQVHLLHHVDFTDALSLKTKGYYQRFDRTWFRLLSLGQEAPPVNEILNNSTAFPRLYALLKGEMNSNILNPQETFLMTENAREYESMGLDTALHYAFETGTLLHDLSAGLRLHQDAVDRDQPQTGYNMIEGELISDGLGVRTENKNRSASKAIAFYIQDRIEWHNWSFNVGIRLEHIDDQYTEDAIDENAQFTVFIPGIGVRYQITEDLMWIAGINKGFSPAGAKKQNAATPEESINYESGFRFQGTNFYLETIGFYSDYQNLLGRCGITETACQDSAVDGGEVEIYGAEVVAEYTIDLATLLVPFQLSYTYTDSAFLTSFSSDFSQWGEVKEGDELPYLPEHQFRLSMALTADDWDIRVAANYRDRIREIAGQDNVIKFTNYDNEIEALTTIDLAFVYRFSSAVDLELVAENAFDEQQIVSTRPLGARPNKPRSLGATISYQF